MEAVVTFEGRGLHNRSPIRAFTGGAKVRRNEKCPCNSGKKFKKCCGR
ncbi:MAG: SEC-C metal-binding domain-containing protein [Thalassovita sp.]